MRHGCPSEVGKLERLLLKHPRQAYVDQDSIHRQWKKLGYTGSPDWTEAVKEYDDFCGLLKKHVPEILFLPENRTTGLDSIYIRDPVVMTVRGAVLGNMGKPARSGEPEAAACILTEEGLPVLGSISGEGRLEGGDVVVFDETTIAVGQGYRTNREGINQLRMLTSGFIEEFVIVPLPHWDGPSGVLHLMSLISPVDDDLAVVYSRLMPVPFRQWLIRRGMKLIEVPDEEYPTMACNVLAVAPRKCVVLAGNPRTRRMLEDEGAEIFEYKGDEISHKGAGGPTCLTRPLLRR